MSRTLTHPPTDRRMWRQLLAAVHPDRHGDHDLFVWVTGLFEYVAGDDPEPVVDDRSRRQRYADDSRSGATATERVPYHAAFDRAGSFADLSRAAVRFANDPAVAGEPYAALLRMLADCYESYDEVLFRQQHVGATYKQLAYIAHLAGMSKEQRSRWYRIAEGIPLSQRHASHLLERLQERAA